MAFDWVSFLDANRIHYVTSGPNVSHGHVAVHCPFCGQADPSQHMAISTSGGGWKCWRNVEHRGKAPAYLVASLLNITLERARDMVGGAVFIPEDFIGAVRDKIAPAAKVVRKGLKMPSEFVPIDDRYRCRNAVNYLMGDSRQFTRKQVMKFTDVYGLRFAIDGPYRGRIIFPVYQDGELKTWTGRHIDPRVELRYKTLTSKEEMVREGDPIAAGPITDYLMWFDDLMENVDRSDTLLLCEGPFDGLKLRVEGARLGVEATCFTTAAPGRTQIDLLHQLAPRYKRRFLVLDQNTIHIALRVQWLAETLGLGVLQLPAHIKDPGLLTKDTLAALLP